MAPTSPRQRVRIIATANAIGPVEIIATEGQARDIRRCSGYRCPVRASTSSHRGLGRAAGAAGALLALWWVLAPSYAEAAPTCTFDAPTATVTVDVGNGESGTIVRQGDAIALDGAPCDTATVNNTDAIVVNGTGIPASVTIDLGGGQFAPGATPENDGGDSEIEFTITLPAGSPTVHVAGGGGVDTIVVGAGGINLNATEAAGDADVLIIGLPVIVVDGNGSSDTLSVAGGSGTGAERSAPLNGGTEGDALFGAGGGSSFDGGAGVDTVNYTASGAIDADLGAGTVSHPAAQVDQIAEVENVTGSPQADQITGDAGPNVLLGGDAADVLAGGGGDDTLDGQAGTDTVNFQGSQAGVVAQLTNGTATGAGVDRLFSIENLTGSAFDDRLIGDNGPNAIDGKDGKDRIAGAGGDDSLDGGANHDTLEFVLTNAGVTVDLRDGTSTGDGNDTVKDF